MTSQIIEPQTPEITMDEEQQIQMIPEPELLEDIPSPDNVFQYPPFADTLKIDDMANKIRKIYKVIRREHNLSESIKNYDKYK